MVDVIDAEATKGCTKCLRTLPLSSFYRRKDRKGAPTSSCKDCQRVKNKAWAEANSGRMRELVRGWQQEHAEKETERRRKWREENRERYLATARAWAKANPECGRKKSQRRRAVERNAFVEDVDIKIVAERDGYVCQLCREAVDMTIKYPNPQFGSLDHVMPLAKGGKHSYANAQLAHLSCNLIKSDQVIERLGV